MAEKIEKVFGPLEDVDPKSFRILASAIAKNNLSGFDYLEFKESIRTLLDMGMDPSTAYKSAFATGSTVGLSLDKLAKSTAHYIQVLQNEKQQFEVALQKQVETKILSREREKDKLQKKIETLEKQIAALEQEKALTQERLENYDSIVEEAKEKLRDASDNFNGAIEKLVEQIHEDLDNIKQYLT